MFHKVKAVLALILSLALASSHIPATEATVSNQLSAQSASSSAVIQMDRSRTKADIVAMARALLHSGFDYNKNTQYEQTPSFSAPYNAGALQSGDIADALNAVKMVRYLAGLPYENVTFSPQLNNMSQHGAVLLASIGQITHSPYRPADMTNDFYISGYLGCSEANLYMGSSNISYAMMRFMAEPGSANIGTVAHRRWMLNPGTEEFGVGYAANITSLYVAGGAEPSTLEADTYVAWPNAGDFPIEYFVSSADTGASPVYPWSVNLGAAYRAPAKANITLTLTRARDNKTWVFDQNTPNLSGSNMPDSAMHLAIDNSAYGMRKAIVFRPDVTSLGTILDGDEFTVEIRGLETVSGTPATLRYTTRFFGLNAELEKEKSSYAYTKGELVEETAISGASLTVVPVYQENGTSKIAKMSTVTQDAVVFTAPKTGVYQFKNNRKLFADVTAHWSAEHIAFVTARELFDGTGTSLFDPGGTMTRAMFVTVLAKLYGVDKAAYTKASVFTDVKNDDWFAWAVTWAQENHIISGTGNNQFAPNAPVTREQMALLMVKYAELAGYELKPVKDANLFSDDAAIDPWSKDAVYTLRRASIISGNPGNAYDPDEFSTRAEVSALLRLFIEAVLLH